MEKVQRIKNSWDVSHPDYAFRYYFYNFVGKERASQCQKPAEDDLEAWEKAWAERPNDGFVILLNLFVSTLVDTITIAACLLGPMASRISICE